MRSSVGHAECIRFDIDFGGKYEGDENKKILQDFRLPMQGSCGLCGDVMQHRLLIGY
jgi:hypothetical protein